MDKTTLRVLSGMAFVMGVFAGIGFQGMGLNELSMISFVVAGLNLGFFMQWKII